MANPIPAKKRIEIYKRDGNSCVICGHPGSEIHHIISAGMGGKRVHELYNMVTLCNFHHRMAHGESAKDVRNVLKSWSRNVYGGDIDELERRKKGY